MIKVNNTKPSERMKIPRQTSIEQKPDERKRNFTEVSFGVDEERALIEAARCLECQNPICQEGVPGQYRYSFVCPIGLPKRLYRCSK